LPQLDFLDRQMSDLDQILSAVVASKKYRTVCVDTVRRIAEHELARSKGNLRAATKATKRRLHQVYGAFEQGFEYDDAYRHLEAAYRAGSDAEIKTACRRILGLHSSTRERLIILDGFYQAIFVITGQPGSILDLGCGLNPLTVPWMGLSPATRYSALDIDADRVRFLNRYLVLAGFEPLARCQDILTHAPDEEADLALLLKMSPSLERQEPGTTLHLLDRLRTPFVAVSFAVKSLAGREKGMSDHYRRQFLELVGNRTWSVKKLVFETELVFVVGK
jgi:16S rRNA (guanine(1405)-N(7))-methyltransferase